MRQSLKLAEDSSNAIKNLETIRHRANSEQVGAIAMKFYE